MGRRGTHGAEVMHRFAEWLQAAGVPERVSVVRLDRAARSIPGFNSCGDQRNRYYAYASGKQMPGTEAIYAIGEALGACGVLGASGPTALYASGRFVEFVTLLGALERQEARTEAMVLFACVPVVVEAQRLRAQVAEGEAHVAGAYADVLGRTGLKWRPADPNTITASLVASRFADYGAAYPKLRDALGTLAPDAEKRLARLDPERVRQAFHKDKSQRGFDNRLGAALAVLEMRGLSLDEGWRLAHPLVASWWRSLPATPSERTLAAKLLPFIEAATPLFDALRIDDLKAAPPATVP